MRKYMVATLLALIGSPLLAEEARTWEGTWNNRKYNSSGTLRCVASNEAGMWKATFSGRFQGSNFSYDVTFQSKPSGNQEALSGLATINGYKYQWTGVLRGNMLTGRYRGNNGYNGEFTLRETGKR